ncbi:2OG-Fe(II) oxygenase [Allopontixanthobacter sp.]|uniref:2OG-Fe(II) oxygenase n=1 Tax=Allopontixanthobacter sp. TaxID=2906452 RepID=UPI002ABB3117|nr:2OG-Fe(II) oxygenase family protein [Allopontixanthobacter sp.]MDZ4307571.1 2OG-Fe(II) oxygenase family protein [Allopontixanthobacter sp.]
MAKKLFEINPHLDRRALAEEFAANSRVQIRDVLTEETAQEIRAVLASATPWGIAAQAGIANPPGPQSLRANDVATTGGRARIQELATASFRAVGTGDYGFLYGHYPMVEGYLGKWNEDGPHDILLEYLNTPEFLSLAAEVTGETGLVKADGNATLFGPQNFLAFHIDSHVAEGWRVAYVLNMTIDEWKPDWGGYLNFFNEDGDIVQGFRPRFNSLNLFTVPQPHSVGFVPQFAPVGRYAISGWLRDR